MDRFPRTVRSLALAAVAALPGVAAAQPGPPPPPPPGAFPNLPPVPTPAANPLTEAKRVLGKALFFDEQLSASNTVACATCHQMRQGGNDARLAAGGGRARAAGADGVLGNADDVFGSQGVVKSDAFNAYVRDAVFGLNTQVTGRAANTPVNAAFAPLLFWDGRATGAFADPVTGAVVIPGGPGNNGALESQCAAPPQNSVEMGHDQIDWVKVATKLAKARPLALATSIPADVAAVLASRPTYGDLFLRAFGSAEVTPARVAMAVASYERTLIANQSPWDRYNAGDTTALTGQALQGWGAFNASNCTVCHAPPQFTNNAFRNIGLRSPNEDLGRFAITSNVNDRGRFKVAPLRNVGLRNNYMHTGQFTTLQQVVGFYARDLTVPGVTAQNPDNLDPAMATVNVPGGANGGAGTVLQAFLRDGLTDPRVRDGLFPFDAPTLYGQRPGDQPLNLGGGVPGAGNAAPRMIASDPPLLGNLEFRLGLDGALPAAPAQLIFSANPPENGIVTGTAVASTVVKGSGPDGYTSVSVPLSPKTFASGQIIYAQWAVTDPSAAGGKARSNAVRLRVFCAGAGCAPACDADADESLSVDILDVFAFLQRWFNGDLRADFNGSGSAEILDIFAFLNTWFAGC